MGDGRFGSARRSRRTVAILTMLGALVVLGGLPGTTFGASDSPYATTVIADGAATYWRLGESSGPAAVDTIGALGGTYQGGVTLGQPGALAGDPDTAILLDGIDDTVKMANASVLNTTAGLTLEAWIKPTSIGSTGMTILRKGLQYELTISSNGRLAFGLWKGGARSVVQSPPKSVVAGTWSHVAATWDGSTRAVYLNGVQLASSSLAGPIDTATNSFFIGSNGGTGNLFRGSIDEAAFYRAGLSTERIQAHYSTAGDISPPVVSLLSPAAGSTMNATPNFGGKAGRLVTDLAAVTVNVYSGTTVGGAPVASLAAARHEGGSFSVVGSPLVAGTYTAQATQADEAGNVGTSSPSTFTIDTTGDPKLLVAGDIAACDSTGDEATAALLDTLPGTVATTGDTVYDTGTPTEYTNCYDPSWGRHLARTLPGIGDHEYGTPDAAGYLGYFGAPRWYSYDLGSWHVIVLDTNCWSSSCGSNSATDKAVQEAWLLADLAANPNACTLVYGHRPRFSSGPHGSSLSMAPVWDIFKANGVDVYLAGHDHLYERFAVVDGIRAFVTGTGGSWLYAVEEIAPNSEVRNSDTFGVLELTLHEGSYDWRFVPVAGKTFTDSGSTSCAGDPPPPDTTPPAVTVTQPANGSSTTDTTPLYAGAAGTASGDLDAITVSVYAGADTGGTLVETLSTTRSQASWSVSSTTPLAPGTYTAEARQADALGNTGTSTTTFTVAETGTGYAAAVLADSPALYWRLGESSGLTAFDVLGALNGTYQGGVTLGQPGAIAGDADGAVSLDGVNDTVKMANASVLNTTAALTLEAWVKPASITSSGMSVLRKGLQYELTITSSGRLSFGLWKGGTKVTVSSPTGAIPAGAWSHVVGTWDGTTATVYINGVSRATGAVSAPIDSATNSFFIGSSGGSGNLFPGSVDEAAIYHAALSASRVQTHYTTTG